MWTVRELKMHLYVGLWSIDPSSPYEWDPTCGPVYAQQQGLLAREVSNLLLKVFGANARTSTPSSLIESRLHPHSRSNSIDRWRV